MSQKVLLMSPNNMVIPKKTLKSITSQDQSVLLHMKQKRVTAYRLSYFERTKHGYSNPLIQLSRIRNNLSHSFTITNFNQNLIESSHKLGYDYIAKLPVSIQHTFKEMGFSNEEASQYLDTVRKFHEYLKRRHIEYTLDENYSTDPEYPNWIQLVVTIRIKSNYKSVYFALKAKLYDILERTVSDNLFQKLIIKIQSH